METATPDEIIEMLQSPQADAFTAKYKVEEKLGEGSYGCVYAGRTRDENKRITFKFVKMGNCRDFIQETRPDEVRFMLLVKDIPGCIQLLDHMIIEEWHIIVMEWLPSAKDLKQYTNSFADGKLSEEKARKVFRQLVVTLMAVFDVGVVHGDIKADNVLINTQTGEIKLIDFGESYLLDNVWSRTINSGEEVETVYQLGDTLDELLHGSQNTGNLSDDLSSDVKNLIRSMLFAMPQDKPSLEQILHHPWVNKEPEELCE